MAIMSVLVRRTFCLAFVVVAILAGLASQSLGATDPVSNQPRRVALVVGNGAYRNLPRLANPANDAELMAKTLKELGFTVVGDGARINLDKTGFDRAIQDFGAKLQTAEVGLFYYAGHGLQVHGTNWLVPVGANPGGQQDLDFQMVNAELVLKQMQFAKTKLNVLILDACRNNPFAGQGLRATGGGLAEMRAPEGTLIAYATQPGNVARDGDGGNSPFSTALATTMRQPGLDVFRLFNQVGLAVKRETGGEQQPWVSSSPIDGDFYFSGVKPSDAPPAPPADPDLAFWQAIAGSTNPADYNSYLQQFPNGRFAALAHRRTQPAAQETRTPAPAPGPSVLESLLAPLRRPTEVDRRDRARSVFVESAAALNAVSSFAESGYRDYVEQFKPDIGPTGKETGIRLVPIANDATLPQLKELKLAIAQAQQGLSPRPGYMELYEAATAFRPSTPAAPAPANGARALVPAAQHYVDTVEALYAVLEPATYYYDQKGHLDDHFAKGRAMHPGIIAAYREFITASEALRVVVRGQVNAEREAYLATLHGDERTAKTALFQHVALSRHLVQFVGAGLDRYHDTRAIDANALKAEIDLVEQQLLVLRRLAANDPAFGDHALPSYQGSNLGYYFDLSGKFLSDAKYLWRTVRDKQPVDSHQFTFGTNYETDLINRFNNFANQANPSR